MTASLKRVTALEEYSKVAGRTSASRSSVDKIVWAREGGLLLYILRHSLACVAEGIILVQVQNDAAALARVYTVHTHTTGLPAL